jgi:thiol-disulfide isomerase/thioredoxin
MISIGWSPLLTEKPMNGLSFLWRRCPLVGLAVVIALSAATVQSQPAASEVTLKAVKYAELADMIRGLKGKVVVVDIWADWCTPCKREFPNLVRLQQKYGSQGLVAVSVALDDPNNKLPQEAVLRFLKKQNALLTNVFLDEKEEVWKARFGIDGPPCAFVFNRDGKYKKFDADHIEEGYVNIEKQAVEFLQQK